MSGRIAIIGGGWAGLACAVELVRLSVTRPDLIKIYEASPQFGGRARGLIWRGHQIDNGQHLTIGAYRQTSALLKTVNAPAWTREPLRWAGVTRDAMLTQDWRVPDAAWPRRLLSAALPGNGPRGWPLQWKWSVAMKLKELHAHQWRVQREPVLQWLGRSKTPQGLIAHFWQPFVEGALNTPISVACAQTTGMVLRDSLAGPKGATTILQPTKNLSLDGVDPISHWLAQQGVGLHAHHRVIALRQTEAGRINLAIQTGITTAQDSFDHVVLALPHRATLLLWSQSALAQTTAMQRLSRLETSAITTVWVELSETAKQRLAGLPTWFILNPIADGPHLAQVAVLRGNILALVMSAQSSGHTRVSQETQGQALRRQILAQLAIDIGPLAQKWITEKQATWACTPQSPLPSDEDTQGFTGIENIFRCADDLEPGYPATIESAVRSAMRTAQNLKIQSIL